VQPYSLDLRKRVLADIDAGQSQAATARRYQVTTRWIYNLLKRRRETGEIGPKPHGSGYQGKLIDHQEQLAELVQQKPDISLEELQHRLKVTASLTTVWRAVHRLGLRRKKGGARG